ncbi:uncharacterized protein MICPUCDRAFT_57223 [Micromonas pusilla CCMP1545]|uniref:Predicted protein n=1 Tax=Micromonas pusilla (strain CCMP1545) TaxID=564608 RepID=C1MQB1_MICPC|nr:uncharacterized protein MICPUCDRAFT_57223 [Micromonas pusilla CCMP1545]EEH58048.1 predicted protein [Micromonas pusilla CCMP1545]|eukprot:XP_003058097.1 predicted protein [Micromonas pusilla CCMP1545]
MAQAAPPRAWWAGARCSAGPHRARGRRCATAAKRRVDGAVARASSSSSRRSSARDDDDDEDDDAADDTAAPPTPTPSFRPAARGARVASPATGATDATGAGRRQQRELFAGLSAQLGLYASLGDLSAVDAWRSGINAAHDAAVAKSDATAAANANANATRLALTRCGVCGALGHDARGCVLDATLRARPNPNETTTTKTKTTTTTRGASASGRRRGKDLVAYYEQKYGGADARRARKSVDARGRPTEEDDVTLWTSGREASVLSASKVSNRCGVCGERGHNRRSCPVALSSSPAVKRSLATRRCGKCGVFGHDARTCWGPGTARDDGKETVAAKLWLLRRRESTSGWLSLSEACETVGIDAKYRVNVRNKATRLEEAGWDAEDDDDFSREDFDGEDFDGASDGAIDARERELATLAAEDMIADPTLSAEDAAAKRGLRRHRANYVGILRRRMLDGGRIKSNFPATQPCSICGEHGHKKTTCGRPEARYWAARRDRRNNARALIDVDRRDA